MVYRNKNFTINFIENIGVDEMNTIINGCHKAVNHLGFKETDHVLVTALPAPSFHFGDSEEDYGFGVYMGGTSNIWIAAESPEELKEDRDWFLKELEKTVIHEFVHWSQDIMGEEMDEYIAQKIADDIFDSPNFPSGNQIAD